MAKQALEAIKEAEKRSVSVIEQANADAAQMISDANKKAEKDIEAAVDQCRVDFRATKESAQKQALEEQQRFDNETKTLVKELEQQLLARQQEAISKLMARVSG